MRGTDERTCDVPLHPVFADRLDLVSGLTSWGPTSDPDIDARLAEWGRDPGPYEKPAVSTRDVPLTAEGVGFRVRVYGEGTGGSPCLVWVHGGAFFAGSLDMNEADLVAREVAQRGQVVVVSVDYGLVPHVTYPVPHRQVMAAVRWVVESAGELGVDVERISLGGASAGASLSLAAARELVATGGPVPQALVLAYPVAHNSWARDPQQEALMSGLPRLLRFTTEDTVEINANYIAGSADPRFAFIDLDPAGRAAALAGLPPALVMVCEYDDLRTSGELLVADAHAAGWPVERRLCAGMLHGHLDRTPVLEETDASLDQIVRAVVEGVRPDRPAGS